MYVLRESKWLILFFNWLILAIFLENLDLFVNELI